MESETKMMKVIKEYGDVLKGFGVVNPVFLMTRECKKAIMNPDGLEFDEDAWIPAHALPDEFFQVSGVVGMYDGVILVEAFNYNTRN